MLAQVTVDKGTGATIGAAGWTEVLLTTNSSKLRQGVYSTTVPVASTNLAFTVSPSSEFVVNLLVYRGVNSSPVDVSGGTFGNDASPTTPLVTRGSDGDLAVFFFGVDANVNITAPALNVRAALASNRSAMAADLAAGLRGDTPATSASGGGTHQWVAQVVALRRQ